MSGRASVPAVPITLITGFLGAGKTTLVNRLLRAAPPESVLIVENEVGDVAIDVELVDAPATSVLELTAGCACCSARDALVIGLAQNTRPRLRETPPLERVLVEASGVANPAAILRSLLDAKDALEPLYVEGVVAVADARQLVGQLSEYPIVAAQIGCADLIVLNKLDLVAPGSLPRLRRTVRAINPTATVLSARRCGLDPARVFAPGLFDPERAADVPLELDGHGGLHGVSAVTLAIDGDLELSALQAWLNALLLVRGRDILRLKGVLAIAGRDRRFVLHGAHDTFAGTLARRWGNAPRRSRLVLIGRGLEQQTLQASLNDCRPRGDAARSCRPPHLPLRGRVQAA